MIIPSHQAPGKGFDETLFVIDQKKTDGRHGILFARAIDPLRVAAKLAAIPGPHLDAHGA
jgi:hypothetical protein